MVLETSISIDGKLAERVRAFKEETNIGYSALIKMCLHKYFVEQDGKSI
jgi:hypothetical protein